MNNANTAKPDEIVGLTRKIREFVDERDWEQFHSPKNLAMAMVVEAAELVEIFQWMSEEDSRNLTAQQKQRAEEEIADVMNYLIRISDQLNIDLIKAAESKIELNARKYPAGLVRGKSKKYSEYNT